MNSPTKRIAQVGLLCQVLNCEPKELTKYSASVYTWQDVWFEVASKNTKTAPHSHYSEIKQGKKTWYLRELGKKSALYQHYKKEL